MHVIKVINEEPLPYTLDKLRADNPNVSFPKDIPEELLAKYSVFPVLAGTMPVGEVVEEAPPSLVDGQWVQQWTSRNMTIAELEVYKLQKRDEINTIRDDKETSGFEYLGYIFDSDERSASRILVATTAAISSSMAGQPFLVTWRTANNSSVDLDTAGVLGLNQAFAIHGRTLHEKANILKESIEMSQTKNEIDGVIWEES